MGKASRDKGARVEREIVNRCRELGIAAERVPLSGAAGGSYTGDVIVAGMRCEIKARKDGSGFLTLERWLGDNDALILRRDRAEPMVVLPWVRFTALVGAKHTEEG